MNKKKISSVMRQTLLIVAVLAIIMTDTLLWLYQDHMAKKNARTVMEINIADVVSDVEDTSDDNLRYLAEFVADAYESPEYREKSYLDDLREQYQLKNTSDDEILITYLSDVLNITELLIINSEGIVVKGNIDDYNGYDMAKGSQSAEFLCLLGDTYSYVQKYGPISYNNDIYRKYAGAKLKSGGFVQVAYGAERFQRDIDDDVRSISQHRHIGETGYIFIANKEGVLISDLIGKKGQNVSALGVSDDFFEQEEGEAFKAEIEGEMCSCMYYLREGYYIVAVMPMKEIVASRNASVTITSGMETLVFIVIMFLLYNALDVLVIRNLRKVTDSLDKIADGNLDVVVDVRDNREFDKLSTDINETVDALKGHIAAEAARIDNELEFARNIQLSALPSVFPPFPERKEFEIFASMTPAKEVGGDFYDFYFVDKNKLCFLVADVSGKSIPGALFMMRAKSIIKNYAARIHEPDVLLDEANRILCENNFTGMFITAWLGIIDLETGVVKYANAGHNPPLIYRQGKGYEYLKAKPNFVLAGYEDTQYTGYKIELFPGDRLFLYTDGITESTDAEGQLFGEDNLLETINATAGADPEKTCLAVKNAANEFAGEVPQFDDMTVLALYYNSKKGDL